MAVHLRRARPHVADLEHDGAVRQREPHQVRQRRILLRVASDDELAHGTTIRRAPPDARRPSARQRRMVRVAALDRTDQLTPPVSAATRNGRAPARSPASVALSSAEHAAEHLDLDVCLRVVGEHGPDDVGEGQVAVAGQQPVAHRHVGRALRLASAVAQLECAERPGRCRADVVEGAAGPVEVPRVDEHPGAGHAGAGHDRESRREVGDARARDELQGEADPRRLEALPERAERVDHLADRYGPPEEVGDVQHRGAGAVEGAEAAVDAGLEETSELRSDVIERCRAGQDAEQRVNGRDRHRHAATGGEGGTHRRGDADRVEPAGGHRGRELLDGRRRGDGAPAQRGHRVVTTSASRATAPAPRRRSTSGLMSSSATSPYRSRPSRCTRMITSTSARDVGGVSAAHAAEQAPRRAARRPSAGARRGRTAAHGTRRRAAPRRARRRSRTVTTGPNTSSWARPTTVSTTPSVTCSATSTLVVAARLDQLAVGVLRRGEGGDAEPHQSAVRLVGDLGGRRLHHDRPAEALGGARCLGGRSDDRLVGCPDAVRGEHGLRVVLRSSPARAAASRSPPRRRRETGTGGWRGRAKNWCQSIHARTARSAVAERAEHGDLRRAEEDVAVRARCRPATPRRRRSACRSSRPRRRGPGPSLSLIGGKRAGDRADEHADGGVGDERVEDLPAPLVAHGVARRCRPGWRPGGSRGSTGAAWPGVVRTASGGRGPAAAHRSAMWAPVPPEIA